MNLTGKVHAIFDVQQVTQSFRKREFVVEYADNPMYPQYILLQTVQDRVELLNNVQVGQMVDVTFNLRGRQWQAPDGETKYFNSLEAWRIQQSDEVPQAQPTQAQAQAQTVGNTGKAKPKPQMVDVTQMDDDDDLPF